MLKPTQPPPSSHAIQKSIEREGLCKATDGCRVEVDGMCPHGHVSWAQYLGLV